MPFVMPLLLVLDKCDQNSPTQYFTEKSSAREWSTGDQQDSFTVVPIDRATENASSSLPDHHYNEERQM